MIKHIVVSLFVSLFSVSAFAQANLNSTSAATTNSVAGATNAGNAQSIHFNSSQDGTTTLKAAPSMGGNSFYGSFSSDNCMVSGGGTVSTIIGGASVVTPIRDPQCSLLRVYERTQQAASSVANIDPVTSKKLRQAAVDMLCQVSDEAKKALVNQGLCSDLEGPTIASQQLTSEKEIVKLSYSHKLQKFVEN